MSARKITFHCRFRGKIDSDSDSCSEQDFNLWGRHWRQALLKWLKLTRLSCVSTHTCVWIYNTMCVYQRARQRGGCMGLPTRCCSPMLSDLLRPLLPKCADVPLGFYLDSSMVCNRLTAQRVSAASPRLSHFLPLLTLIHIYSVCAEVRVCVQSCRRRVCLTITKMFSDNKREMMMQRNTGYCTFLDKLQNRGAFSLQEVFFPGTSLRAQEC